MGYLRRGFLAVSVVIGLVTFVGCDGSPSNKVAPAELSPEAKSADEIGRKAMEEYLQSKSSKKKGAAVTAPAPAPTPSGGDTPK